ncbi:MAG: radical SAM protein [Spirulinaceae cyanobacterium SM2_1_0]|nr:radical SAM protein [Spirulinaceae cyanobacterium SM2_1_0]
MPMLVDRIQQSRAERHHFRRAVTRGQPYKPIYVKIKIAWVCNLRCAMCNHWREASEPALDLAFYRDLVAELAALGCQKIHLTGGEPMLWPDLEELIRDICDRGIRPTMTSNGTRIDAERARALVAAGLRKINISLDSPEPALHDQARGVPGAWEKAVAACRHLRPWLRPGGLQLNTVISALNYASLGRLPDLAIALGVDRLNLIPLDEHTPDIQRLSPAQIQDYNRRIGPVIARKALSAGLLSKVAQAYPFGGDRAAHEQSSAGHYAHGYYEDHPCFAPWTHCLIDHVGRVSVCCMLPNQPVIGDLRTASFREIWTGDAFAALRRTQNLPLFDTCRHCDMFIAANQQLSALVAGNRRPD